MRILLVTIAAALVSSACYREHRDRYVGDADHSAPRSFDAYTTEGEYVRVQQNPRSGEMVIVEPQQLRGEPVAMVSANSDSGMPLVARNPQPRRQRYDEGRQRDRDDQYGDRREGDRH